MPKFLGLFPDESIFKFDILIRLSFESVLIEILLSNFSGSESLKTFGFCSLRTSVSRSSESDKIELGVFWVDLRDSDAVSIFSSEDGELRRSSSLSLGDWRLL